MFTPYATIEAPVDRLGLRWRQRHKQPPRKIPVRWMPPTGFIVQVAKHTDREGKRDLVRVASEAEALRMGEPLMPA
jgi:hypothetical protein